MRGEHGLIEVGQCVINNYWRSHPAVFRNVLSLKLLNLFGKDRFLHWTALTCGSLRLFESFGDGRARSGILSNAGIASELFAKLQSTNKQFTLHMNDVELVDEDIFNMRQALGIPFWWRVDDVIGTLSSPGSGIGYHAGHEDGFIIQLSGSRRWRVWKDICTPLHYRAELLAPSQGLNPTIFRPTDHADLLLDVELSAGDVLYIPPYFPHEGITIETSVSLSIAWKGLAPYSFLPTLERTKLDESNKHLFKQKAVTLFNDDSSADIAIGNWLKTTCSVVPNLMQSEVASTVEMAITNHILKLSERYCTS